ncbi:hypothetical protein [Demequina sp.]|uniref:hypothetical protein n=1 Tax=Demequina sp. TaxID=2050685 RepID=UPI0025BD1B5F|nr:hypothetical protein [Demequina sp.]
MATTTSDSDVSTATESKLGWVFLSLTRISLGFVFLWAFFDKLLALGYSTGRDGETGKVDYFGDAAWISGGHVTEGYLTYGSNPDGPFHDLFVDMGSQRWTDWLFMLGLLGIGAALMLGIGTKIAAWSGAAMMVFMFLSAIPLDNNPIIDDHIVYALAGIGIVYVELRRQSIGLGGWWRNVDLVKKNGWLV